MPNFCRGVQVKDASVQFDYDQIDPNEEEAQLALRNKACCHVCRFDAIFSFGDFCELESWAFYDVACILITSLLAQTCYVPVLLKE